jgi:hypothetical protein
LLHYCDRFCWERLLLLLLLLLRTSVAGRRMLWRWHPMWRPLLLMLLLLLLPRRIHSWRWPLLQLLTKTAP